MKKGVTLLIAVFIASLALAVAIGIFTFLFAENQLSVSTQDSFAAFRAADSGLDCVLFHDNKNDSFALTQPASFQIECGGGATQVAFDGVDTFTFDIDFSVADPSNKTCTRMTVVRGSNMVSVTSLGESKKCSDPSSTRVVQRGIQLDYPY